jgi:hypothetical protein
VKRERERERERNVRTIELIQNVCTRLVLAEKQLASTNKIMIQWMISDSVING